MNTLENILTRRSAKHFDAHHPMPDGDFERLTQAAMSAPTSFNIQHWRFVRVTDMALRQSIRQAAWDQAQVTDASELLVITGNTQAWNQQPERYWSNTDAEKQGMLVDMLREFYRGRPELQRDEAIRSGALAAQNLMLAARELGYESNAMIGFDFDEVSRLIKLPDDHVIVMLLAIGKPLKAAWPRGGQLPVEEIFLDNGFR